MMLNVRRLTRLTSLIMMGFPNLVGDAAVAALATSLPPDLAILELELSGDYQKEVKATGCMPFCRVYMPGPQRLHLLQ
jgi:hypothetical protein